ncbi:MAG: RCC1 domain-containing protein [Alphaproteobacteria bacterium]
MTTVNLGKIKLVWKGAYNPSTPYTKDDLVSFLGSTYICIQENTGYPPNDPFYWDLFAAGTDQLGEFGDLVIHDGTQSVPLNAGSENSFLKIKNGLPSWGNQESRPGTTVKKMMQGSWSGTQRVAAFLMNDGSLRAVGQAVDYANGQTNANHIYLPQTVPVNPDKPPSAPFKALYRNYASFFAVTENGEVYSWGHNDLGMLGHGDTIHRHHAIRIDWFFDQGIQIAEVVCPTDAVWASSSTYFITTTGELYACGNNSNGQLGDGTTTNRYIPVRCGNLTGVKQVSASCSSYTSVFAIDGNDALWSWGHNSFGQLGHGDTVSRHSPTKVTNISNVKQVSATGGDATTSGTQINQHALVLLQDGTLYGAGDNRYGQLGLGDTTDRSSFTLASGSLPPVKEVFAAGSYYGYGIALDENDELWTWGYNNYGVLGLGDEVQRTAPTKVAADFQGNIAKVVPGGNYSYAQIVVIEKSGHIWGAGYNGYGQLALGNGHVNSNPFFRRMLTPFENPFIKIVGAIFGGNTSEGSLYALTEDGRVLASGYNNYGQCGTQPSNLTYQDAFYTMLF